MTGYDIERVRALLNEAAPQVGELIDVGLGRTSLAVAVVPHGVGTRPWVVRIAGDHCRIKTGRGEVVERRHQGPEDDTALLAELTALLFPDQSTASVVPLRPRRDRRVTWALPGSSGRGTPRRAARSRIRPQS